MVRTISRRDCLKLALAVGLGLMFARPWLTEWPMPRLSDYAVPIEGLGLGIRFTSLLRAFNITTIGKLLDVLNGKDRAVRPSRYPHDDERMLHFEPALVEIRERFAAYAKSGPVPFATLTRLETEVRNLVVTGRSDKAIAWQLGISKRVLKDQFDSLYWKMQGLCAPYPLEAELSRA